MQAAVLYKGHAFSCSSGNCEWESLSSGAVSDTLMELSSGQKGSALCDVLTEKKCHLWVQNRSTYISFGIVQQFDSSLDSLRQAPGAIISIFGGFRDLPWGKISPLKYGIEKQQGFLLCPLFFPLPGASHLFTKWGFILQTEKMQQLQERSFLTD